MTRPHHIYPARFRLRHAMAMIAVLLMAVLAGCGSSATTTPGRDAAKVERVVDGDTLEVTLQGKKEKVRLIGIDTPETKKPKTPVMYFGKEASDYTKKRLQGKTVELEWDVDRKDQYDRWLAYVWIDGELFNRTLVQEGFARMATFPPNVKYVDRFRKDQEDARSAGKGLWKDYAAAFGASPAAGDSAADGKSRSGSKSGGK